MTTTLAVKQPKQTVYQKASPGIKDVFFAMKDREVYTRFSKLSTEKLKIFWFFYLDGVPFFAVFYAAFILSLKSFMDTVNRYEKNLSTQ